jgi:zinc/manganese transport system substrate-binding protein
MAGWQARLGLEGWIDRFLLTSGYRGKLVIASQGIHPLRQTRESAEGHSRHERSSELDPHAWQDLTNARRYVDNIASALAGADPTNKLLYQANAARLKQEMSALDSEIHATFNALPAERREVATSHNAFAYLGRAYGIRFIAPVGISTAVEPTAADVGAIIRQIRQKKTRALFIENVAEPRLLERISRESGARIGGTLYSDSLSQHNHPADSYLGMMRHNARTLAAALAN